MKAALLALVAACVEPQTPMSAGPAPLEVVWSQRLHLGDVIAMVPGTGSYDMLGKTIDALPGDEPVVDVRALVPVAEDAIVLEQAIAAAHRAGIDPSTLTFTLWGCGFTRVKRFEYVSWERLHVKIEVLGGSNSVATGSVFGNLINYTTEHATTDATALYADLQTFLAAHPGGATRNVVITSHSWGGAVAEWLVMHYADIATTPLGANLAFAISAGVPGGIPNFAFAGPSFTMRGGIALYEIDRPDDPVHALNPNGNGDGHQYDITDGDSFIGSYGITTDELSCAGVLGICP